MSCLRCVRMAAVIIAAGALSAAAPSRAETLIGSWESGAPEGWIDWSNGQTPLAAPRFGFNGIGATAGAGAVQFNLPGGGYTQWASIKLQMGSNGVDEWRDEFLASAKVAIDITLVADEMDRANTGNDFANIGLFVNADGYGFTNQGNPESVTPFTGFNGTNAFNPLTLPAGSTQTSTWVWDIADTHDGTAPDIAANPGWIELIFDTFSNGGVVYHLDNVRLVPVPEPASLSLIAMTALLGLSWMRKRGR